MTEELREENMQTDLSAKQIFTEIWASPRRVLSYIHVIKYQQYFYVLWFFAGAARALDRAIEKNTGDQLPLIGTLLIAIIIGGLLGWISFYIYAALVSLSGRWLNGKGNTKSLFRIFAYANIPAVILVILYIIQISIYGNELFKADGDITSAGTIANITFYGLIFFEVALSLYTLAFMVVGVSVVQEFSIGKAILNIILPILFILIPILVIVLISEMV